MSLLQKMRVKVDGKKVTLPYIKLGVLSVMRDGYRVILRTNGGEWILISEGVRKGIKKTQSRNPSANEILVRLRGKGGIGAVALRKCLGLVL